MTLSAADLKAQAAIASETARKAKEAADTLRAAARKAESEERRIKRAAEHADHYGRMYSEIGVLGGLNMAQHDIVYAQAYEQGHSSGYEEVQMYYGEFAEMARKILEAN